MIHLTVEFPFSFDLTEEGVRIDLPGSALDGFIARDVDSAKSYLQFETRRAVASLLSSPVLQTEVEMLTRVSACIAPNLTLKVDLRQRIVYFPDNEMLSLNYTIMFLHALSRWRNERGNERQLDNTNYTHFLAQAQEAIRNMRLNQDPGS